MDQKSRTQAGLLPRKVGDKTESPLFPLHRVPAAWPARPPGWAAGTLALALASRPNVLNRTADPLWTGRADATGRTAGLALGTAGWPAASGQVAPHREGPRGPAGCPGLSRA